MIKTTSICFSILLMTIGSVLSATELGETLKEEGTRIELPSGDFLQLSVEDMKVMGRFTDAEGLLIEPLADSIVIVVDQPGHKNDEWRTVISPTGENSLTSPRLLRPPYDFRARIIVRLSDGSVKTYPYEPLELDKGVEE